MEVLSVKEFFFGCFKRIGVLVEQLAKEDYVGLRQEATDLQEYSTAKLERVTRYLGVLADKSRKLGKFICISC